ncbi:MAG TPA: S53 family peptidase [Chloroflexota bacterium]|nr:S53 family peptidase [Chloroflexota bacterium]
MTAETVAPSRLPPFTRWGAVIGLIAVLLLLSGCGASGTASTLGSLASASSPRLPALGARDQYRLLLSRSKDLGPAGPAAILSFFLSLRDPTAARERANVASIYNPASPHYGHFDSPQSYASRYGPSPHAAGQVLAWLRARELTGRWRRGDDWLYVTGPTRAIERAFHTAIHVYLSPRKTRFLAAPLDPVIPPALHLLVTGASHVSNYFQPQKYAIPAGGLTPGGLLKAYDIQPLRNLGFSGQGQTVVFFELDGYKQADFDQFTSKFGLPPIHPIIRGGPRLSTIEGETEMDLEVVHAIAPQARLVLYNIDWSAALNSATSFADLGNKTIPLQDQMITENPGAVISESWGICETLFGPQVSALYESLYRKADSLGETAFVSTGDSGAFTCLEAKNPGTPPGPDSLGTSLPAVASGATAVGGTRLSVRTDGSWFNETVWEDPPLAEGGGGGVSAYVARPSWQRGPGVDNLQVDPNRMREIPDVSADADPDSGTANITGGQSSQGGGTSQSAPIMAGIATLVNQYLASRHLHRLGFLNPALYALAAGHPLYPTFHDVTIGSNLYYPAGPGYDLASGLGSVDAWNLARDLAQYQKSGKP